MFFLCKYLFKKWVHGEIISTSNSAQVQSRLCLTVVKHLKSVSSGGVLVECVTACQLPGSVWLSLPAHTVTVQSSGLILIYVLHGNLVNCCRKLIFIYIFMGSDCHRHISLSASDKHGEQVLSYNPWHCCPC